MGGAGRPGGRIPSRPSYASKRRETGRFYGEGGKAGLTLQTEEDGRNRFPPPSHHVSDGRLGCAPAVRLCSYPTLTVHCMSRDLFRTGQVECCHQRSQQPFRQEELQP